MTKQSFKIFSFAIITITYLIILPLSSIQSFFFFLRRLIRKIVPTKYSITYFIVRVPDYQVMFRRFAP